MPDIHVSAAVIHDESGRVLVVRKQGTTAFMQPGGKPEAGENPAQTLARELEEELGLSIDENAMRPLGRFISAAANEPGHRVIADAFALTIEADAVTVQAELAELRWITPDAIGTLELAPLSLEHLLPIAWPDVLGSASPG
ncbi:MULTISPECIES: NUDIX domain-containing protein [unclassified Microbacterium]|uniref:NUDIX hydrolase n=1 Tax=unclassified Microbacterium TaxID=2609290 RepID=UPI001D3B803F|nr:MULTISPECIES: NUDIX domain-containing protein [unclassified Microbacterium]CAH0126128.1 RNA pyrophosphohydrolase [Microbacterium sp. Bi121]HWK77022.1 NUDIX domain-containing protein [Microbacterium sp.]